MRVGCRGLLTIIVVTVAMAVMPIVALAATTYADSITGAEVYATVTEGRFAGAASGDLPGSWHIDVLHDPLTTTARIIGGTFSLTTVLNGQLATVRGVFANGGQVTQTGGFSGCTDQAFALSGALLNVGPSGAQSGAGSFSGVLTHHRHSLYGYCVTYSASVTGGLRLTF